MRVLWSSPQAGIANIVWIITVITIAPVIGKIFDGILNNRRQFAKECLSLGDPLQNGFKPNASAIDNVFLLNGIADKYKANDCPLFTCFVIFKSVFDLINRSALLFNS